MDDKLLNIQELKKEMNFYKSQLFSPWNTDKAEKILDREISFLNQFITENGTKNFKLSASFEYQNTLSIDVHISRIYKISSEYYNSLRVLIQYSQDFDTDISNFENGGNITIEIVNISNKILDDEHFSKSLVEIDDKIFFVRKVDDLSKINIYECLNDLMLLFDDSLINLHNENNILERQSNYLGNSYTNDYQIFFTTKAYVQLLTEIEDYPYVETGGVLVGQRINNTFYVFETVDPGFKADRQRAEFSRHYEYTEHLAYKVAKQYEGKTTVIGYYHRHPGSYDHFSGGDDVSNLEFAKTFNGVISGLVNIDPNFRLSFYYISPEGYQSKAISYQVDDKFFEGIMYLKNHNDLIKKIQFNEQTYNNREKIQIRNTNEYYVKSNIVNEPVQIIYNEIQNEIAILEQRGFKAEFSKLKNDDGDECVIGKWYVYIKEKKFISFNKSKKLQIMFGIDKNNGNVIYFDDNSFGWKPYVHGIIKRLLEYR